MQTLLNFIVKHNHWFLFLLLEGIGVMLIVQFNNYQSATAFTSANRAVGGVFATISDINSYFNLKNENEKLLQHNRELNELVEQLNDKLSLAADSSTIATLTQKGERGFTYNTATVVNNSINRVNNYITLDKGTADGVLPEMGIFCDQGVVGIIYTASQHYSVAIPLLNSKSNISCRIKGSDSFSTLQWRGGDTMHSYLVDLPRYSRLGQGDTVVTSGFSSIFPKDIPIGTIETIEDSADGMFYCAKIRLFTDFSTLDRVYIVGNKGYEEQKALEKSINDK
ncbi:MAG: rod shape-determining protein MreC [Bacteroidaceae bacterium]|nr:rod shape-determining protein MreC [Bacteroidaceae bacterium]